MSIFMRMFISFFMTTQVSDSGFCSYEKGTEEGKGLALLGLVVYGRGNAKQASFIAISHVLYVHVSTFECIKLNIFYPTQPSSPKPRRPERFIRECVLGCKYWTFVVGVCIYIFGYK